ncbi:MAG: beta-eliminating lyase-related protein [Acidaminobacteraceae bacterium]
MSRGFASDNYSGVHTKVLEKIAEFNVGHVGAYGTDKYTSKAKDMIKEFLGASDVYFVLNGTGANITCLDGLTSPYGAVICSKIAHIFTHESGAASKIARTQLLIVDTNDGKIKTNDILPYVAFRKDYHCPKPEVISISQPTEMGAVYSLDEIKELADFAHENGMKLHMDGARISNAAVSLGVSIKTMTSDMGVDALSFGMSKNGIMFGESIVFFDKANRDDFDYIVKQDLQLQSKMRFTALQYMSMIEDGLWKECASNANDTAQYMLSKLEEISEVEIVQKPDANIMFIKFPVHIIKELQEFMYFYVEDELQNYSRLVTSFDTTNGDVDLFIAKLKDLLKK